jgi:hypothetical protein
MRVHTSIVSAFWLVVIEGYVYLIDVDVLARIHVRKDARETYQALIEMA